MKAVTEPTNHIVESLRRSLGVLCDVACGDEPSTEAKVRVVSYRDHFEYLWDANNVLRSNRSADSLIVVWDGVPSGPETLVDLDRYVTAFDWAVWFGLTVEHKLTSDPNVAGLADFRVLIIDISARKFSGASGVRFFDMFPGRSPSTLPWLRIYHLASAVSSQWELVDLWSEVAASRSELHGTIPTLRSAISAADSDVETVKRIWTSFFLRPAETDDHHAISNLVAPLLLMDESSEDVRVEAVRKLLQTLELLPSKVTEKDLLCGNHTWFNWRDQRSQRITKRIAEIDREEPLRILVVDDAVFQQRWGDVICRALGAVPTGEGDDTYPVLIGRRGDACLGVDIYGTTSADECLHALRAMDAQIESSGAQPSTERFRFAHANDNGEVVDHSADVLILDLRLHQGRPFEDELEFFKQLLPLAWKCLANGSEAAGQLPWSGFSQQELKRIDGWIERASNDSRNVSRNDPQYHRALTLLPRLIALADFTLPIIVFSSTGNREITEPLGEYGTILTDFDKPRLQLGNHTERLHELSAKFRRAVISALEMVAARRLCTKLVESDRSAPEHLSTRKATTQHGEWKIHLMVDETDIGGKKSKKLKVGGLLAVYPPDALPNDLDEIISTKHPDLRRDKRYARDESNKIALADTIVEECEKHNVVLLPVSLIGDPARSRSRPFSSSDVLHDEHIGDNLHRQLLRSLIEVAIYCVARRIVPEDAQARFSVFAATRVKPPVDDPDKRKKQVRALLEHWGVVTDYVGGSARLWKAKQGLESILESDWGQHHIPVEVSQFARDYCNAMTNAVHKNQLVEPDQVIRYFNRADARPLVEETMTHYEQSRFQPPVTTARAYYLNEYGTPEARRVLAMHFFVDAYLHRRTGSPSLDKLHRREISGSYDDASLLLMQSHRFAMNSRTAQAIAYGGLDALTAVATNSLEYLLGLEIKRSPLNLNGVDFLELTRLLMQQRESENIGHKLRGTIYNKRRNDLFITDGEQKFYARQSECKRFHQLRQNDPVIFDARPATSIELSHEAYNVERVDE